MSSKLVAQLTLQEIFDTSVKHLRKQGRKSTNSLDGNNCLYRGPGGTSCALGCLITDEECKLEMEGQTAFQLYTNGMLPF